MFLLVYTIIENFIFAWSCFPTEPIISRVMMSVKSETISYKVVMIFTINTITFCCGFLIETVLVLVYAFKIF